MNKFRQFFRPAERHEDGRLKTYDEMSEEGKAATKLRLKFVGIMLLITVLGLFVAWEGYKYNREMEAQGKEGFYLW